MSDVSHVHSLLVPLSERVTPHDPNLAGPFWRPQRRCCAGVADVSTPPLRLRDTPVASPGSLPTGASRSITSGATRAAQCVRRSSEQRPSRTVPIDRNTGRRAWTPGGPETTSRSCSKRKRL